MPFHVPLVVLGSVFVVAGQLQYPDLPGIQRIVLSDDGRFALLTDSAGRVAKPSELKPWKAEE